MSNYTFICPHCRGYLSANPATAGMQLNCPTCDGRLVVPAPPTAAPEPSPYVTGVQGSCPYCRNAIAPADPVRICPTCKTPHHAACWNENKGCTVFGCAMAPQEEEKIILQAPESGVPMVTPPCPDADHSTPLFLHIPISRLVCMSIATMSLYEFYWIYKNWSFLKQRNRLDILPFWRGLFGIFFCHGIFRAIRDDPHARSIEQASFAAGLLATGWIITQLAVRNLCLGVFAPTFLFFIPVQNYVNRVTAKRNPGLPYTGWTNGHIVCLVLGILQWLLVLMWILSLLEA